MASNRLVVDTNIYLVVAAQSSREGHLDGAVACGRSRFDDVRNDGGGGTLVDDTTPQTVRRLETIGRLIVARQLWDP